MSSMAFLVGEQDEKNSSGLLAASSMEETEANKADKNSTENASISSDKVTAKKMILRLPESPKRSLSQSSRQTTETDETVKTSLLVSRRDSPSQVVSANQLQGSPKSTASKSNLARLLEPRTTRSKPSTRRGQQDQRPPSFDGTRLDHFLSEPIKKNNVVGNSDMHSVRTEAIRSKSSRSSRLSSSNSVGGTGASSGSLRSSSERRNRSCRSGSSRGRSESSSRELMNQLGLQPDLFPLREERLRGKKRKKVKSDRKSRSTSRSVSHSMSNAGAARSPSSSSSRRTESMANELARELEKEWGLTNFSVSLSINTLKEEKKSQNEDGIYDAALSTFLTGRQSEGNSSEKKNQRPSARSVSRTRRTSDSRSVQSSSVSRRRARSASSSNREPLLETECDAKYTLSGKSTLNSWIGGKNSHGRESKKDRSDRKSKHKSTELVGSRRHSKSDAKGKMRSSSVPGSSSWASFSSKNRTTDLERQIEADWGIENNVKLSALADKERRMKDKRDRKGRRSSTRSVSSRHRTSESAGRSSAKTRAQSVSSSTHAENSLQDDDPFLLRILGSWKDSSEHGRKMKADKSSGKTRRSSTTKSVSSILRSTTSGKRSSLRSSSVPGRRSVTQEDAWGPNDDETHLTLSSGSGKRSKKKAKHDRKSKRSSSCSVSGRKSVIPDTDGMHSASYSRSAFELTQELEKEWLLDDSSSSPSESLMTGGIKDGPKCAKQGSKKVCKNAKTISGPSQANSKNGQSNSPATIASYSVFNASNAKQDPKKEWRRMDSSSSLDLLGPPNQTTECGMHTFSAPLEGHQKSSSLTSLEALSTVSPLKLSPSDELPPPKSVCVDQVKEDPTVDETMSRSRKSSTTLTLLTLEQELINLHSRLNVFEKTYTAGESIDPELVTSQQEELVGTLSDQLVLTIKKVSERRNKVQASQVIEDVEMEWPAMDSLFKSEIGEWGNDLRSEESSGTSDGDEDHGLQEEDGPKYYTFKLLKVGSSTTVKYAQFVSDNYSE